MKSLLGSVLEHDVRSVNGIGGGKAPRVVPVDHIWWRIRRPFRYPRAGHACSWERFDADKAGCVLCGALHVCSDSMIGCKCPLIETDDSGHVCLITGLCIPEVKSAHTEFVDSVCYDRQAESFNTVDGDIHGKVSSVVRTFLTSNKTVACRKQEYDKYSHRTKQAFWRVLKQRKRNHPYALPCLCSVVAEVAYIENLQPFQCIRNTRCEKMAESIDNTAMVERVIHSSIASISGCLLQIQRMGFRKIYQGSKFHGVVIGMLYMSRTGLYAGDFFHLVAVRDVHCLLPSETYLKSIGVSNKVICDTENEIKSCIRIYTERK